MERGNIMQKEGKMMIDRGKMIKKGAR